MVKLIDAESRTVVAGVGRGAEGEMRRWSSKGTDWSPLHDE